ncbi:MAG: Protein-L-isoaspartate (D-aspartate) O-methyltransferase [Candidatus Saccharibacteria bacterium]|nr:Protein-L-isoaspartate (D-aspartate) O-methyltransferase [Candidatus Saccharibacteria bacterium]
MDVVEQAFREVNRTDFVPDAMRDKASIDAPLPIGFGQTISQPSTVRSMLRWLDAKPGNDVLDVGSGSGWTTALLSYIVGSRGRVFAVERIPELVELGRDNINKDGVSNVQFFQAIKEIGLPEYSPYDRILVSASAQKLPKVLLGQLKTGGKLVVPVRNDILEITRTAKHGFRTKVHPGFVFVPLL